VVTDGRQFCSKVNVIGCSLFSGRVNSFILIFYNVMQVESLPCSAVLMSSLSPEQRPCLSRRVTVQEQISSSFMDSPPPPHLDAPLFGADLIPSGRLRRMRGWRHSPGGLEEEVRHTIALQRDRRLLFALSLAYTHQPHRSMACGLQRLVCRAGSLNA
jgi:hypothetical protein